MAVIVLATFSTQKHNSRHPINASHLRTCRVIPTEVTLNQMKTVYLLIQVHKNLHISCNITKRCNLRDTCLGPSHVVILILHHATHFHTTLRYQTQLCNTNISTLLKF